MSLAAEMPGRGGADNAGTDDSDGGSQLSA